MAMTADMIHQRWRRLLVASWALIGLTILIVGAFWALGHISSAITPFALAAFLVFVLRGLVNRFEGFGLSRGVAVTLTYLVVATVLTVAGLFIVPPVADQVREFIIKLPDYFDNVQQFWIDLQGRYEAITLPDWLLEASNQASESIGRSLVNWSSNMASSVVFAGGQVVNFVFNLVLALVIGFYLLRDLPVIREELLSLAGSSHRDEARMIYVKISTVVGGYLKGQLIISAIVGALIAIGLWILGVPYALVIGLIAGLFNIVPYVGPIVGEALAAISAAFVSPMLAVWAVVLILGVQQIDSMFISPRVMSEQVDLHPTLVIFSLLTGAAIGGLMGMLVAIPVAAVGKGLFVYYFEKNTESEIATSRGALFRRSDSEVSRTEVATDGSAKADAAGDPSGSEPSASELDAARDE